MEKLDGDRRGVIAVLLLAAVLSACLPAFWGCGAGTGTAVQVLDKTGRDVFPKIREIIYPTLGYPQLVPAGDEFTLEFDLSLNDPEAPMPIRVEDWRARAASSNGYVPYEADLEIVGAETGKSERWPEGSGRGVRDVYAVTVRVPGDVPPDLYDLEVRVKADGREVADAQPNCLAVIEGFKEDYRFVQLTDIHVFDIEYPTSCMHDREPGNAVYLSKAVEQINLMHPDFVVFTGDLIYGQKYMPEDWPPDDEHSGATQYEYEYLWAYEAISELDVPCFFVMGNHDGYYDTVKDGFEWWTESFGPLFYSFDYGGHHFTAANTMDWSRDMRLLEKGRFYGYAQVLQPVKWMGQVREGGDPFGAEQAPPPEEYGGQLGWIRDDLAANRDAGLRFVLAHHDPAQLASWDDADYGGYRIGGRGEGRLAMQRLCSDYRVAMLLSGHEHHDLVTTMPWSDGQGATIYANTTCLEPKCGTGTEYSGYRLVEVAGDRISSYEYAQPGWSMPLYAGTVPGTENDRDVLSDPALAVELSNGGDWSAGLDEVAVTVTNGLDKDLTGARLELFMPAGGVSSYKVEGAARVVNIAPPGSPHHVIVHAYLDLPAGSRSVFKVSPI